jgi:protein SCO1/2
MIRRVVTLGLALAALQAAAQEYDRAEAVEYSQAAIGTTLNDYRLRDTLGQTFDLSQLRGRPLVVSMIYTSCHHICPTITRNLAKTLDKAREALGEDAFTAVTIGFDWKNDSPDRMRQFAVQQGVDDTPNWYFLATDALTVDPLAENLGFLYYPSAKGFDHLVQTTVVDAGGTIYRQVLFCTVYDPNSDRYRFDYSIFLMIIIGVLCLGAVAAFIVREWRSAV